MTEQPIDRLRAICLALPEAVERVPQTGHAACRRPPEAPALLKKKAAG